MDNEIKNVINSVNQLAQNKQEIEMDEIKSSKILKVVDSDADVLVATMTFIIINPAAFTDYVLNNVATDDLQAIQNDSEPARALTMMLFEHPDTDYPLPTVHNGIQIIDWGYEIR